MPSKQGGSRLREMRLQAGLTQDRLGGMAGLSQAQVQRLESGRRRLTFEWMVRLAQAMERSPEGFFADRQAAAHPPKTAQMETGNAITAGAGLARIAAALERLAPPRPPPAALIDAEAFVWQAGEGGLEAVMDVNRIDIGLLKGIDANKQTLLENTRRFAKGLAANNALLWGARGAGKSSLIKAVHADVNAKAKAGGKDGLALVEIHREDIPTLPRLLGLLGTSQGRCLLFCDDLSFDGDDASYKSLKAVLEGGVEGRPANVLFYATSNRRHLMARAMIDNEGSTAIHPGEAVDEKVSLSDRFGLWLGFHAFGQETYLDIVKGYATNYGLEIGDEQLRTRALEWARTRGARSGRVAWQFIQDLAGGMGRRLD